MQTDGDVSGATQGKGRDLVKFTDTMGDKFVKKDLNSLATNEVFD